MDEEFEVETVHSSTHTRRNNKNKSFIIASVIAVALYLANVAVTCLFYSLYLDSYIEDGIEHDDEGLGHDDCFLFLNRSEYAKLCDFSLVGSALLFLLEIVLVTLGAASIASGKRSLCPKCIEVTLTLICLVLSIVISMIISYGYGGKCVHDEACEKNEKFVLITCWIVVVLFFIPSILHMIDCLSHLPSQSNFFKTQSNNWIDKSQIQGRPEETVMFLQ